MRVMDPTCRRCGSDAAVTWTTASDGTHYTCRFSHSGDGPVSWMVPARRRPSRVPAARGSAEIRTARKPAEPHALRRAESSTDAPANVANARLTVNERGIAAVIDEVTRRGGHGRVQQEGTKREVIVTGDGDTGAVRLVVRARTAGGWQTRASYGEPRAEEENPATFWVLVHLSPVRRCATWCPNGGYATTSVRSTTSSSASVAARGRSAPIRTTTPSAPNASRSGWAGGTNSAR